MARYDLYFCPCCKDKPDGQPAEWVQSVRQVMRHHSEASGGGPVDSFL